MALRKPSPRSRRCKQPPIAHERIARRRHQQRETREQLARREHQMRPDKAGILYRPSFVWRSVWAPTRRWILAATSTGTLQRQGRQRGLATATGEHPIYLPADDGEDDATTSANVDSTGDLTVLEDD